MSVSNPLGMLGVVEKKGGGRGAPALRPSERVMELTGR